MRAQLFSSLVFILPTALLVLGGSAYTAYRAEVLREPIKFSWGLVPFAVIGAVLFSSLWYSLCAVFAVTVAWGRVLPRATWLTLLVAAGYASYWFFIEALAPQAPDTAMLWPLVTVPIFGVVLFRPQTGSHAPSESSLRPTARG
ncbi:MAG: hypothetical protein HY721_11445 [Planctomycetes bacterium]|nr:hypothetical protein [Planctomycetota bacterium]